VSEHRFLTGLILAAGMSKRLGQPKQLLPYRGTTLLGWALAQAEASQALDEVLLVLGHAREDILAQVTLGRAQPVTNVEFSEGCAASYRAGLAAADPRAQGVMILLSDQPGIDIEAIERVAAAWRAASLAVAVSPKGETAPQGLRPPPLAAGGRPNPPARVPPTSEGQAAPSNGGTASSADEGGVHEGGLGGGTPLGAVLTAGAGGGAFGGSTAGLILNASYQGVPGHPLLFDRRNEPPAATRRGYAGGLSDINPGAVRTHLLYSAVHQVIQPGMLRMRLCQGISEPRATFPI
jgi:CTP:molybdopterin cytidylyltransferase MocA